MTLGVCYQEVNMRGADQLNASENGWREESYKPLLPFSQMIIWLKKGINGIFLVMYKAFIYILLMSVAKLSVLVIVYVLNVHLMAHVGK